ncbi:hypothetical protein QOZ80_3BG0252650 [Eleusine coracana subsp. coracana]|nr:hypothetical protein QOZ80_3BG0252650 [Eleusine coracana subsp. coracana]
MLCHCYYWFIQFHSRHRSSNKEQKWSRRRSGCRRSCAGVARFHPSFFVCRRHDDQKRYYELRDGDPPYAAKFYDCCGAEDPDAPGCTTDFHRSYDDPDD